MDVTVEDAIKEEMALLRFYMVGVAAGIGLTESQKKKILARIGESEATILKAIVDQRVRATR